MSRTTTLELPDNIGGTDLRPVLTIMPVPADGATPPAAPVATADEEAFTPAEVPQAADVARRRERRRRRNGRRLATVAQAEGLRARVGGALGSDAGSADASQRGRRGRRGAARAEQRAAAKRAKRRAAKRDARQAARDATRQAARTKGAAARKAERRVRDAAREAAGTKARADRQATRAKRRARARTAEKKAELAGARAGRTAGRRRRAARVPRRRTATGGTTSGKRLLVVFGAAHVVTVAATLRDALAFPDPVWDTAGISRTSTVAKVVLVPFVFVPTYRSEQKPKLEAAREALRLQGG